MNSLYALEPQHTITQSEERLSASSPVRVFTHVFRPLAEKAPPRDDKEPIHCGDVFYDTSRHHYPAHDHDHYEIGFVTGGTAIHRTAMCETRIQRRSVYVIAPGQVHELDEMDGVHIVNCAYLPEWLLHDVTEVWGVERLIPLFMATGMVRSPDYSMIPQHLLLEEEYHACMRELRDIGVEEQRRSPSLAFMKCSLEKLMIVLARALTEDLDGRTAMGMHEGILLALRRVEAIISENSEFRVALLAEEADMSPPHFAQVFKEATGWSPMDYFQRRRIQRASWMLLHVGHSITDVAHTLGFCDAAHFCHQFKRHKGMSPRTYRKLFAVV